MQIYKNLTILIDNFRQQFSDEFLEQLKKNDKIATGAISNSIGSKVFLRSGVYGFDILGDERFKFVEYGRSPNRKMPPKGCIDAWLNVKGIPLKFDYIIRRNIGIRGIKPTPVTATVLGLLERKFVDAAKVALATDLNKTIIVITL